MQLRKKLDTCIFCWGAVSHQQRDGGRKPNTQSYRSNTEIFQFDLKARVLGKQNDGYTETGLTFRLIYIFGMVLCI